MILYRKSDSNSSLFGGFFYLYANFFAARTAFPAYLRLPRAELETFCER